MFDNHTYNLLEQLAQEHKSAWRIKKMYLKDAENCEACTAFWKKLDRDKEDHIQELEQLLKGHLA